jgi:hypothetical protein
LLTRAILAQRAAVLLAGSGGACSFVAWATPLPIDRIPPRMGSSSFSCAKLVFHSPHAQLDFLPQFLVGNFEHSISSNTNRCAPRPLCLKMAVQKIAKLLRSVVEMNLHPTPTLTTRTLLSVNLCHKTGAQNRMFCACCACRKRTEKAWVLFDRAPDSGDGCRQQQKESERASEREREQQQQHTRTRVCRTDNDFELNDNTYGRLGLASCDSHTHTQPEEGQLRPFRSN